MHIYINICIHIHKIHIYIYSIIYSILYIRVFGWFEHVTITNVSQNKRVMKRTYVQLEVCVNIGDFKFDFAKKAY